MPAHHRPQRWRLAEHDDPLEYVESRRDSEATWRNNCSSVAELSNKVVAALDEQVARGQIFKLIEQQAKVRFPDLVAASLEGVRKVKPNGTEMARVIFDCTHSIYVTWRTRIRDEERAPIASDIKTCIAGEVCDWKVYVCPHSRRK